MNKYIDSHIKLQKRKYGKIGRNFLIMFVPLLFVVFVIMTIFPAYVIHKHVDIKFGIIFPVNIILGMLFSIAGLIIYIWTIILFSRVDGTQIPIAPTQKLVVTGPYAITRNPMLTGAMIVVVGLGIMIDSLVFIMISMIVPSIYLCYIKLVEEKELEARFGEEYKNYKINTPFFVPKFRRKK